MTMRQRLLVIAFSLIAACRGDGAAPRTSSGAHALDVNQLIVYWHYKLTYTGSGEGFWIGPVRSDAERATALQDALDRRSVWCNALGLGAQCIQNSVFGLYAYLCPTATTGACDTSKIGNDTGWTALISRLASENTGLISYLESRGIRTTDFQQSLQYIGDQQHALEESLADALSGQRTSAEVVAAAHEQLGTMAAPKKLQNRSSSRRRG